MAYAIDLIQTVEALDAVEALEAVEVAEAVEALEVVEALEDVDAVDQVRRPKRCITDRMNLFNSLDEDEFIDRFHLSKETARILLDKINIPENQDGRGSPLPPHLQMLTTLHWLATGSLQSTIADSFDVSQQVVSNCIRKIVRSIAALVPEMIRRPKKELYSTIGNDFYSMAGFPGVLGVIDCTHIPILSPGGAWAEDFRCKKGFFSLNCQAVCGPNLEFFDIVCRWPGSVHESRIFNNSRLYLELQEGILEGHHLLGSSAYPLHPFLLTPVTNPTSLKEVKYNTAHSSTRNTIARAFSVLKRRFRCLSTPMRLNLDTVMATICSSVVLHNLAIEYKDIVNVMDDIEEDNDDPEMEQARINVDCAGQEKRHNIILEHFS